MNIFNKSRFGIFGKFPKGRFFVLCFAALSGFLFLAGCDALADRLRFFGEQSRRPKPRLDPKQIEQWQRDLRFNKTQVLELHDAIADLTASSHAQGLVSWKIAKAYMQQNQFEMGASYINEALRGRFSKTEPPPVDYERILPFLDDALRRLPPSLDLVYDAGLCYANASRARGWEDRRFEAAERLFSEMLRRKPDEGRALYALGLMYGKATNRHRDPQKAIRYLDRLLSKEDKHIPARFARAHILVETGRLADAVREYEEIQNQLKILEEKGVLKDAETTPNFRQAQKNIEKLQTCLSGSPGCEVLQP